MHKFLKLFSLGLISVLLLAAVNDSSAQVKKKKVFRSRRDSLIEKQMERNALIRSFKHTDDAALDDLLGKIEDYTSLYIQTNSDMQKGFDTLDISERLPTLEKRMAVMKKTIDNSGTLGYLVTIRDMVDHVTEQTKDWETQLSGYSDNLDTIHSEIEAFKNDKALKSAPEDTTLEDKYILQVQQLTQKWNKLDSCAKKAIVKIGSLQNRVSALSILMIDLNDKVDIRIHQFTVSAVGDEDGYIWQMHPQKDPLDSAVVQTYNLNYKLFKYFLTGKSNYWLHAASVLLLLVFFTWIVNIRRKINRVKAADAQGILSQTRFIIKHPYASAILVFGIISPYFYDHPAQIVIQTMFIITMIAVGILIRRNWPAPLFNLWKALLALLVFLSVSDLMLSVLHLDRILLLIISAAAIYLAFNFLKYIKPSPDAYPPYMALALKLFIAIQAISIVLNIAGRFSIAKIAACTATFDLCLAMGLYLLIQILMESLFLQLEANKSVNQSLTSYLDFTVLQKKFRDVVVKVTIALWFISVFKNMAVDDYLYDTASDFLSHKYQVSNTAFSFGSALTFIIIIWLSGLVARVISYFYDFSAQQQTKLTPQAKKTRSSILLIRLTVFVIGFFVAINAAGIPMNEVTLVIGALGVGIGFGLQNIVNNLVSGIILAFEKPVQVGDIIEVANKTGTITEIGIRSSKIDCGNGSELIVPNGDLISQHVINWTLSNNNRQVELVIGVAYGSDVNKVQEILDTILSKHDDIMKTPAPSVMLSNFGESSVDFKMLFWAAEIGKWASLRSKVMSEVYTKFGEEGIKVPTLLC
jgi:small-conductance mechanosensitive channel